MKQIEIQPRITITQKEIDKTIKHYEDMPGKYKLCFGEFDGDKDDIIREIKKLSKTGKQILLMNYNFKQYIKGSKNRK